MRAKVTEQGVLIPKDLLQGVEEVDIEKRNGLIVVSPIADSDPIYDLGRNPIHLGVEDSSVRHDVVLDQQETLADFLHEHVGVLDSSEHVPGGARMSEGSSKKFADGLLKRHRRSDE